MGIDKSNSGYYFNRSGLQAGIIVKLDLYEGMWHVFQEINFDLPESIMAHAKMKRFLEEYLKY